LRLALIILILAAAPGAAQTPASAPINVVGHAWAPFISPMGEPFRARTATDDTLARWFDQADRNRDGVITADEMQADADRFFAALDSDGDGQIGPEELIHYEWELAPDIQVNSKLRPAPGEPRAEKPAGGDGLGPDAAPRRRDRRDIDFMEKGLEGGARYGLLNIPEPVAAADADFNRAITRAEFRDVAMARFQLLDSNHQGRLTLAELEALRTSVLAALHQRKRPKDATDTRVGAPLPPER
jgi:Ca2+-binding EF-hand superfamily protein